MTSPLQDCEAALCVLSAAPRGGEAAPKRISEHPRPWTFGARPAYDPKCQPSCGISLVINHDRLVAALELKSQVGPSFGNNFNNRTEEAIGTAVDLWTAFREGAFGETPRPFVGWLMLVEDAPESRAPVKESSAHFETFAEFKGASYLERYNILCRKLAQERLYTTATIMASPRSAATTGEFVELSELTGLKTFITSFAGHIAAEAAR